MREKLEVSLVADGDPFSPKTWSGTPKALAEALISSGWDVTGHSIGVPDNLARYTYLPLTVMYGRGARAFRNYYGYRAAQARQRMMRLRAIRPEVPMIHMDHIWLPYPGINSRDYIFRDTDWSSYARSQHVGANLTQLIEKNHRVALRQVGHIFCTSDWCKDRYIRSGVPDEKVTVVGTGVGTLIPANTLKPRYDTGRTLFVAKVRLLDKGFDLMLEGFKLAQSKMKSLRLDMVVPKEFHSQVEGVTFHSNLSGVDLVSLYANASLFAMPARYEPWGLVYLEAQLAGLPVVGSGFGAFPQLCSQGATGLIVKDLTPQSICSALIEAHSDPASLARMGLRARQNAERYAWSKTAALISDIISAA